MNIREHLYERQDKKYRDFTARLIPNIPHESIIGVRIPNIRSLANDLIKNGAWKDYIYHLPHEYFEEYHLHSFIISQIKDFDECIAELERFLPFVDNWSVCDSLRPRAFIQNKEKLLFKIEEWLKSEHTYTMRFAIEMLMVHYLDEDFIPAAPELVLKADGEDYYLKMMIAWYFATGLAKKYNEFLPYFENKMINDCWTHNKAIQKATESLRISEERKCYLKTLKV